MTQTPKDSPQQKLLTKGAKTLTDAELLTILLGGRRSKTQTAQALAEELLAKFGDLPRLLETEREPFRQQMGQKIRPYLLLKASIELSSRYWHDKAKTGGLLAGPEEMSQFLYSQLNTTAYEAYVAAFFDAQKKLIRFEEMMCGPIDDKRIYQSELRLRDAVLERALQHQAATVVVAHYSPDGDGCPRPIDVSIGQLVLGTLYINQITLLDYLVMGKDCSISLMDKDFLCSLDD